MKPVTAPRVLTGGSSNADSDCPLSPGLARRASDQRPPWGAKTASAHGGSRRPSLSKPGRRQSIGNANVAAGELDHLVYGKFKTHTNERNHSGRPIPMLFTVAGHEGERCADHRKAADDERHEADHASRAEHSPFDHDHGHDRTGSRVTSRSMTVADVEFADGAKKNLPKFTGVTFEEVVKLAKDHHIPIEEVRKKKEEFESYDTGGAGELSLGDLRYAVRDKCNIPANEPLPEHLMLRQWAHADTDGSGTLNFKEFLLWSLNTAYSEEMMVTDPLERQLRAVARNLRVPITDVERVKAIFDKFDLDGSDSIDEDEFNKALFILMEVTNPSELPENKLKRYWRDADVSGNGEINFEEFLLWYLRSFG